MSAFVVETEHIDALLTAGLTWGREDGGSPVSWWWPALDPNVGYLAQQHNRRDLSERNASEVGAMLLAENVKSVNFRYTEQTDPVPYSFSWLPGHPHAVTVLNALDCFDYQACEHPMWRASEAFNFCQALRDRAIHHLPGYAEAKGWSISDRNVFLNAAAKAAAR